MPFLDQCLKEILRLYTPSYFMVRIATDDTTLCGVNLPPSLLLLPPYVIHRLERYYKDPEEFVPERWTPEFYLKACHENFYLPFGAGKRICVGRRFALLESKIALAHLFQRFDLSLVPGQKIVPKANIQLRPAVPVKVQIKLRTH